jgi:vitamin K-dependent gamma-carboxylase
MRRKQSSINGIRTKKAFPFSLTGNKWFATYFLQPVSPYLLSAFQLAFLIAMFAEGCRLFVKVPAQYFDREIFFPLYLFKWIPVFPNTVLGILPVLILVAALIAFIGYLQRVCLLIIVLIYGYFFVIEISYYNNHYYLLILVNLLLLILPGNRPGLAGLLNKKHTSCPSIPYWYYQLFKGLLILVYFAGGLVKLNLDWVTGKTMAFAFAESLVYKEERHWINYDFLPVLYSWLGLIFDLAIGFLLVYSRTRIFGIIALLAFHLINAFTLDIGVFPWFMMMAVILFIEPDKFDQFLNRIKIATNTTGHLATSRLLRNFIVVFIAIQLLLPPRHLFIRGNVDWTGEGAFFAWRMKAASRKLTYFKISMFDKQTGKELTSSVYLKPSQIRALYRAPAYLLFVRDHLLRKQNRTTANTMMYAQIHLSMNGHSPKPLVDSMVDLCQAKHKLLRHNSFITSDYKD